MYKHSVDNISALLAVRMEGSAKNIVHQLSCRAYLCERGIFFRTNKDFERRKPVYDVGVIDGIKIGDQSFFQWFM